MERVTWQEYKGKKFLYINYSGLNATTPAEKKVVLGVLARAREVVGQHMGKILFLSDVTNTQSDKDVVNELKAFAAYTASSGKVDKECVVGVAGVQKALVTMINMFSKSKLVMFSTVDEAKDWLIG